MRSKISIRKAIQGDEEAFWQMQFELDKETNFMLYESNERSRDLERVSTRIARSTSGVDLLLFAQEGSRIVGYLSAQRGATQRIRHSAYLVLGIRQGFRGQGIGTRLLAEVDDWAQQNAVTRLELTVMCSNITAIRLYERCGFVREGVKKNAILFDGVYIDELYMSKLLTAGGQ